MQAGAGAERTAAVSIDTHFHIMGNTSAPAFRSGCCVAAKRKKISLIMVPYAGDSVNVLEPVRDENLTASARHHVEASSADANIICWIFQD